MGDTKTNPINRREILMFLLKPGGRKVGLTLLVSLLTFGLLGAGALIPGHCASSLWVKIPCFGPLQLLLFVLFSFVGQQGLLVLSVCLVAAIYAGVCLQLTPLRREERQWLSGLAWVGTALFVLLTLGLMPLNQLLDRDTADCTLADTLPANVRPPSQASLIAF